MNIPLSLIYQRWTETIGIDQNGQAFKEQCEFYYMDEKDELRIQELELKHRRPIIQMIKGNLEESISCLSKTYGFSSKERMKWSEFFLGYKQVYESLCPQCKNTHIHHSKTHASSMCNVCQNSKHLPSDITHSHGAIWKVIQKFFSYLALK